MTADVRVRGVVCAVITTVGVAAAVLGVADHLAVAALVAAGIGWLALRRVRDELRIRRRVADTTGTRPAHQWAATGADHGLPPSTNSLRSSTSSRSSTRQIPRQAGPVPAMTDRIGGVT